MVRETRHLWVGNLPDNIREDRIREHFKRYGRVQSVKLLPRVPEEKTGEITMACTVAFMDIKSASKAHNAELKIDDRTLNTEYYEPAAIPSAASPQNTPSPYSTSPGATRFPNGHGSSDEHGTFPERFYDRTGNRVAPEGEFIRRTGYHDSNRGRNRDRNYRNGPYNSLMERHPRTLNNSWTFDSSRYNNSTNAGSQSETGYNTTPSDACSERRNSDQGARKTTKSRSGSRSPSPEGSASSRSPSRSRSRSSSSSSSSSASRDTSSTGSPKSRRQTSSNQNSDDRRPLAICVKNLPLRSSDTSLKDGLFHEYKKHGKVTWVKVVGQNSDRHAIVCFKKPEDVEKALEVSYDKLFFGCKIEVAPYAVCEVDDGDLRPYEAEIDEYHPKATRTLFIGNLEKDVTASDLRKHFDQFGEIIEIDIKKQGAVSSYAFCQYSDIVSVVKAIRKMDGEHLGNNRIKLGFGKSMPYNCVWIDGINENVNEKYLKMQFEPFGTVCRCIIDRDKSQALVSYEQVSHAQQAVAKMRGFVLKNTKLQVDFASRECQECFFERLEKHGTVLDRTFFEEKGRDSSSRSFDSSAVATRFSRYDTPTRPRTSSYSSRSSAAASQVTSAIPSPGTPGSVTPRGAGSRSRVARFYEYDQAEYADRHFRSYDEYSQGSAASHEDTYEPEYIYAHESPTHLDPLEVRVIQNVVETVPFAPPDIRNLQKERVHLLEQLEECPSSGDELISPKKRLKLDLLDTTITSDVIIEANRDHRKVMEVRRLSDANLRHHARRPSVDSGKYKEQADRQHTDRYMPHTVGCKRRKTGSSDSGSRVPQYDHSGSESVGGSRPGTPLCDEKPENFPPSEPRRVPRDRDGPLTLPLPRFAAQLMNRGSVSVAGIKGQKDATNILSSPPPAATSPRISNPRPPSPVHVPPPASPPPRPPSLSSNSSDSDAATPSPSLEERIRSLDEKYEKWSGSRALSAAGGDALALLDANREKFRLRHKLLDIDLKEVQPSEIVKSVLAKRSVFDEDLKRLENVGEKYEPKDFGLFRTSTPSSQIPPLPTPCLSATSTLKLPNPVATQLPKTPTMLSPRSTGTGLPAAKGLQYPFPSHPPVHMSPVPVALQVVPSPTTAVPSSPLLAPISTVVASSVATQRSVTIPGDNRLNSCVNSSDTRTANKVTNNGKGSVAISGKPNEKGQNISSEANAFGSALGSANTVSSKTKLNEKTSDKISCRRDSNNSNSPRADVKTRRNSDTSARRIEDSEKFSDSVEKSHERAKSEERRKDHRFEKAKLENERLEKEKAEKERIEKERVEKEKQEKERLERERLEKERLERESELEKQRLEKERLEKERLQKERLEKERQEKEEKIRLEKERIEKERAERERIEKERLENERLEKERLEKERLEQERLERERRKEKEEKERKEKEERDRKEKLERERKERERHALQEKELLEKQERERKEFERKEREDRERKEREEKELRAEEEREEKERFDREKQEKERRREEERIRHKDDNHHDKRKEEHRHRENHSEIKHKENNVDKYLHDSKLLLTKEDKPNKDLHEVSKKESHASHDSTHKNKHNLEKESERRKESVKENRDNNIHDKHKHLLETKDRAIIETRHMSIDLEKNRSSDNSKSDKRKERNNSLPANLGLKRRMSSHELVENNDECKRMKLNNDHKKLSERRDSKDSSRSDEKSKSSSKHKNNHIRSHDKHNSTKDCDDKRKEKEKEREERHKRHKLEKQKSKSKSREKDSRESPITPSLLTDKDFLARLNLRANEDLEKEKQQRKEAKEKRKELLTEIEKKDEKKPLDDKIKKEKDKQSITEPKEAHKSREEISMKFNEERKQQKRERIRKITNSSDSDSDEPKKHSIFDIVDDEPAYISMYDKVKARSCKNMQKQEEEKRQEKIKAKFSQLKQSRARREEKKRSTSWDEDSESDRDEMKFRRCPKMLIVSSDDESQERKIHKKRDTNSDSDSSMIRHIKSEIIDTTDDDIKSKHAISKSSKSRITSDTSEDEYNKKKNISELFSENDQDVSMQSTEIKQENVTSVKNELERLIKKERRNSKFQDPPVFGEYMSAFEAKVEKHNSKPHILDNTTDDEAVEIKKERSDRKEKRHKKKQKKQKHSTSDDSSKIETDTTQSEIGEKKHHDKKKDHSKKEKKREKVRDGREKSKKSKKPKESKSNDLKRDGKIENIFGSLSEDSEGGVKEPETPKLAFLTDENAQHPLTYNSDSERESQIAKIKEEKDREHEREEHKRRKEKRRREKEKRLQAVTAAVTDLHNSNENSMDYADMAKQLEANIKDDADELEIKHEEETSNLDTTQQDLFVPPEHDDQKKEKEERKEGKEKKKKRKKSKEEKTKHHHHHHHDKNKVKSPEIKKEPSTPEIKIEISEEKTPTHSLHSLPSIFDIHSPAEEKPSPDFTLSPSTRETKPIISPIPKTPTSSKEKKRDKLIPGFGSEIDEQIHESAVKSISDFKPTIKEEESVVPEEVKEEKSVEPIEEKPRVVISQEETEDAVAALLGESFGGGESFDECYNEEVTNVSDVVPNISEEANAQDDEEMRQAVQSLSSGDIDVKPDTPQSEPDLQIDTDTEEQDDNTVPVEQPVKTTDLPNFELPAKVPEKVYSQEDKQPVVYKSTPNIGSPPSLTPIKPHVSVPGIECKKKVDDQLPKSLPLLPEQQQQNRTVISQSWTSTEKNLDTNPTTTLSDNTLKPLIVNTTCHIPSLVSQSASVSTTTLKTYGSPITIKMADSQNYPPLTAIPKDKLAHSPTLESTVSVSQAAAKSPNTSQLHNLPARSPVQIPKTPISAHENMLSPKSSASLNINRLPITPVMISKPLQPTTVLLPQSKIASHSLEPPKLVPTSEPRMQERPRMVFQPPNVQSSYSQYIQGPPRGLLQPTNRHVPPSGLLVHARHFPLPNFVGNVPPQVYNVSSVNKDNSQTDKVQSETMMKLTQPPLPPNLGLVTSIHQTKPPITLPVSVPPVCTVANQKLTQTQVPLATFKPTVSHTLSMSPIPCSSPVTSAPSLYQSPKPTPVISEPQKSVISPPVSVVDSTCLSPNLTSVTSKPSACIPTPPVSKEDTHLVVPKTDSTTTSTPSPVIVANPLPEFKECIEPKSPVKLAIEKVTEELNDSLKKEVDEVKEDIKSDDVKNEDKPLQNNETECQESNPIKPDTSDVSKEIPDNTESETTNIVQENKKEPESILDDNKVQTTEIIEQEDPLDTKEDSDYWSAKEVNIDSVIKTLCSADEMSDHGSENDKDEWTTSKSTDCIVKELETPEKKDDSMISETEVSEETTELEEPRQDTSSARGGRGRGRGGRGRRGRGAIERGNIERAGIQTRRGKLSNKEIVAPATPVTPSKRGRGGRAKTERKGSKSEIDNAPSDVYEFKEDSDDNKEQRPRLVLTIKSSAASSNSNSHTTAIVKEITKDGAKEIGKDGKEIVPESSPPPPPPPPKSVEAKEEFAPPQQSNTRKSRRLQEKDISRNTVDDTIEDVVKNTVQTRASAIQRRSGRQGVTKPPAPAQPQAPDTPRKSPRGRKPRRASEANSELSSSEETIKEDAVKPKDTPIQLAVPAVPPPLPVKEVEKPVEVEKEKPPETPKEKPFEGLKAAMLRRIKGELSNKPHEPTQLIDPVTGLLIPMRECEEGRYIPLPGSSPNDENARKRAVLEKELGTSAPPVHPVLVSPSPLEPAKTQTQSVIAQPFTVVQQPVSKPQSLKAHVLSSQAAKAVVTQQVLTAQPKPAAPQPQQIVVQSVQAPVNIPKSIPSSTTSKIVTHVMPKPATSIVVSKPPVTPVTQNLNINTSLPQVTSTATHSPRPYIPVTVTSKVQVKPPVLSPNQQALLSNQQKQFVKLPQQQLPKPPGAGIPTQAQIINTQMAHMKHQNVIKQQVIVGKTPLGKPVHSIHQQAFTGQLGTPPISKSQTGVGAARIIQGVSKGVMEPPKVDVNLPLLGRPNLSPQGQARITSLPGYEASLHGETRAFLNRSRSPPPAHQNSPSPKGEPIQGVHFSPAHLRLPPDINPAHYMHPHVMQYHQQLLRQQQLQHLQRNVGLEKSGEEGEEAPVTSPPLELRRPGSVGLGVPGRAAAVPHSLHSPHDRATESPQMGQVYNAMHPTSRIPAYHPNQRYFDQSEPPPAHQRSMASHGSLAALGSDRGMAHMAPLGSTSTAAHHQPDRAHPGHLQPDRPLSGHAMTAQGAHSLGHPVTPSIAAQTAHTGHSMNAHMGGDRMQTHIDRPLSSHGLMGAGLGAAGNLMGAVAKHIGADAPTSQRGLQAATPPHASQVPPQAESLLMLLKQYPLMWQGLLALKNDQAAVQMYFVSGNDDVAKCSLPKNTDGSTPPLRIFQRMRLEPPQVEGVARKMQMEHEHCMLLALPCGHDHMDVLKQSTNLTHGFITYLQQKQAAGIVNVAAPGTTQPPAYVVHIFPSCDFVNENLRRIAPSLLERVADIAHLLIVITTV